VLQMCKYSKLNLNTFAHSLLRHSGTLAHTQQRAANATLQQRARKTTKVFKLSFEYLHIYSPKPPIFAEINSTIASLMSCLRSDLWKTLNTLFFTA